MLNINQTDYHNSGGGGETLASSRSAGQPASKNQLSPFNEANASVSDGKAKTPMAISSNSLLSNQAHFPAIKGNNLSSSSTTIQSNLNALPQTHAGTNDFKSTNVHINLIHAEDADVEEFHGPIHNSCQVEVRGGNTPIKSPKKKSMIGITEMRSALKVLDTNGLDSESNKSEESSISLGDVEESILEQAEGMGENFYKISNMTLGHNFNIRFEQNRQTTETLRRKSKPKTNETTLTNPVILDNLIEFLGCGDLINFSTISSTLRSDTKFKVKVQHQLRKLVLKGLDTKEQHSFWNAYIKFKDLKNDHATAFTQNFVRKCTYIKDIKKDLDRTLPEYDKYSTEEGKNALLKVLVAVSNSITDIGYIQGLNSIAGVFLFYLKEEQAFWATLYLLEKLKVKDLLKENFQTIHLLNYQFKVFFENYLPQVAERLNFQVISLEYITTPWFITLFSYFLPLPQVLKLWNFFFLKGLAFFIQFGLAIFAHYKDEIIELEPDEVPIFLKNKLRELEDNDDCLFEKALEFKVTKRLMQELSNYYNQGQPKARLLKDDTGRLKWQLIRRSFSSEPNINLEKIRADHQLSGSKTPHPTSKLLAPLNESNTKESPFKLQSFLSAITAGIPDTLKNMFTRNKSARNDHSDSQNLNAPFEPHEKVDISQAVSPPNRNTASAMEKEQDSDGVVYLLEKSPENLQTQDIIPDGYMESYQENYTISDKGMLYTDSEDNNLLFAARTEPNEQNPYSLHDNQREIQTTRTNITHLGNDSARQAPLKKFSDLNRTISGPGQEIDQRLLRGISLPKFNSVSNADENILSSKGLMLGPQQNDLNHSSTLHHLTNNNNQKFTSRPSALCKGQKEN